MSKVPAIPPFRTFRDQSRWQNFINSKLAPLEENPSEYLKYWYIESRENIKAYPSQGMLLTPFDDLGSSQKSMLPADRMMEILRVRQYFLELLNHPERIKALKKVQRTAFHPPPKVNSPAMDHLAEKGVGVAISDLGVKVVGSQGERVSRKERLRDGPFAKLGKYARSLLVGSAMPDIWGSVYAISTMAQCLSLVGVPRNGPFNEIKRQADLVREVFVALDESEVLLDRTKAERDFMLNHWKHNVMGVIDATPEKALPRAEALYKAGARTFRVYSPEPGITPLRTVEVLRKEFGDTIEIFAGQVVDTDQAAQLEEAGADGLYIGIGGGGRCITGVRSGSVIDWPMLLWEMRGKIGIPVIVEGGASDHIAATLSLGASGIGVSRVAGGGTIESPGGMLYCIDEKGRYFKPYGGEASARTKYLDNKMLPFDIPSFVEGETRRAYMNHLRHSVPTIPFHVHKLTEDIILSFVFRGVKTLKEYQELDPSPLRQNTPAGVFSQNTH